MNPIEVEILELTNRIKEVGQICETLDTDCEILSSQFDRASRAYDAAKREYSTALCVGIAGDPVATHRDVAEYGQCSR